MANKKYTDLTAATTVVDADLWAQSQNVSTVPVSKKVTSSQFWTYILSKTLSNAGNPNGAVAGTAKQLCYDSTNHIIYICTTTGTSGTAVWSRADNTFAFAGNPNGSVAGQLYDFVFDTTNTKLWVCSTAGTAPAAVWTQLTANITVPVSLANGGTAKALVADNGGIVYSDADSFEILAHVTSTGKVLQSGNATAPSWSTATYPSVATTTGSFIYADGTNYVASTSLWPNTVGTSGKIIASNGTANIYSTATFPIVATSTGSFLYADGTNWVASTSLWPNTVGTALHLVLSNGTTNVYSTPAYPNASVTAGKFIISDGTNYIASTSIMPNTVGTAGKIIRSDGTVNAYSTSTFADTYTASNLLYSNGANTVTGLATANSGFLVTDSSGVPSISSTVPAFTTSSITFSPTTGGIVGTTTNDNAAAGKVGEFVSAAVLFGSAVSITTTATAQNLTSISLTAGDWDVTGSMYFVAAGSVVSGYNGWTSVTSATLPDVSLTAGIASAAGGTILNLGVTTPTLRVSISGTTTVYLSGFSSFTGASPTMSGNIQARRIR